MLRAHGFARLQNVWKKIGRAIVPPIVGICQNIRSRAAASGMGEEARARVPSIERKQLTRDRRAPEVTGEKSRKLRACTMPK